jgi:hypothetical protein
MQCYYCLSENLYKSTKWGWFPFIYPLVRCGDCGRLFHVPFWVKAKVKDRKHK